MDIDVQRAEAKATVIATGEMDSGTAYDVYAAVVEEAVQGFSLVVLDLAAVSFIDSVGLSMLIRARDELATNYESRLALRNPSEQVARLLSLTALSAEFDVSP